MQREQKYQTRLGELEYRVGRPAQETIKRRLAFKDQRENQEVQRQKSGQRQTRDAVEQGGQPQRVTPMAAGLGGAPAPIVVHTSTTAATAVKPRPASNRPQAHISASSAPPRQRVHSLAMTRTPMAAWVAAATTKAP